MNLSIDNLSFSYKKDREVLKNVTFSIKNGESISILGRNGSGKTTLIRLILGFLKAPYGTITIDGDDISTIGGRARAEKIAYIPQHSEISYPFTVLETAVMGAAPRVGIFSKPSHKDYEKAEENLRILGIDSLRNRQINMISGGERQLAMIARALTQDAELLLLDEPANELDYSNQLLILEKIEELRDSGYSVLFSTHNPEHALMIASSVLILSNGVSSIHRTDELKDGRLLSELYNRELFITEIDTGKNRRISCLPK